jgi:FkbM family methyltransferase
MKPYPLMTHPVGLALRSLARRFGIVRLVAPLIGSAAYEEAFSNALLKAIRPGDCVWDVGANVGHYTTQFASLVGPLGRVIAFEPSPRSFARLEARISNLGPNVFVLQQGLGSANGRYAFELSDDDSGVTDQISRNNTNSGDIATLHVDVCRGDDVVREKPIYAPNVIKVDVEGYELDVLKGMPQCLAADSLRSIFVEVHFGTLERRGLFTAPREIEALLRTGGFDINWIDHSHLVASRARRVNRSALEPGKQGLPTG